jgi:hypothetical protein
MTPFEKALVGLKAAVTDFLNSVAQNDSIRQLMGDLTEFIRSVSKVEELRR